MVGKPSAGKCCICGDDLDAESIFHWSPGSWAVWCFYCYKSEHYDNLKKLQKDQRDD